MGYDLTGRAPREEEDAQGPREEAHHLYPPLRQRHHDWWQEKDEPQPDHHLNRLSTLSNNDKVGGGRCDVMGGVVGEREG